MSGIRCPQLNSSRLNKKGQVSQDKRCSFSPKNLTGQAGVRGKSEMLKNYSGEKSEMQTASAR